MKIITDTKRLAAKHGVKIILGKGKKIRARGEKLYSAGYFSDSEGKCPILAVATGKPEEKWLPIFIHESCHLDQYLEDNYMWQKFGIGYDTFFNWLEGNIELDYDTLKKCCTDVIECELDCEKRSIKKIKKYGITSIKPSEYIKKANAYLYSIAYMMECRIWKNGIYESDVINKLCPSKFQTSYMNIPIKLKNQFRKAYKD